MTLELHISVLDGDAVKETLVLSSGVHRTAKIGRMASAAIRLEDPSVARIHAVIEIGAVEATLVDMGTTAGTLLGDERVQRSVLSHGDRIGLGETVLLVGIGEPAKLNAVPDEPVAEPLAQAEPKAPAEAPTANTPSEPFTGFEVPAEYQVVELHDADDVAPELLFDEKHALLELRRFVAGELVSMEHLHANTPLILGESKRAQVFVGDDILPKSDFPLVRYVGGVAELQWADGFTGQVVHQNQEQSLEQWAASELSKPVAGLEGCHSLSLDLESKAQIDVGGWSLELSFVAALQKPPLGLFRTFDFAFANLALFSLLTHLLLGMYLYGLPAPDKALDGAFFEEPDRFASLLLKPPKVEEPTAEDKATKKVKTKKELQEVEKQLVVADQDQPVDEEDARDKRKDELKEQFSALFDDGSQGGTDALLGEAAGIGGNLEG
ncbi:MAG: FHA domain-containing protein, partial [Deltaproteobacteria bacterium]|nr:FHA domain-containing protein [Deltaproteobacteria bacterium]